MNKISLFLFIAVFAFLTTGVQSQESKISAGINFLGSDISTKFQLSDKAALRLDIDFLLIDVNRISFSPQLLFYKTDNAYDLSGSVNAIPYHGPGFGVTQYFDSGNNSTVFALSYLAGMEFQFEDMPYELFMDAGPAFSFDENSSLFGLTSSLGVRYKF